MTERELYISIIPDVAEIIVYLNRISKEDQQQIKISEELFHSSRPPSSPEPSSNLFMIHMHRKMRSIMTSAIAEPRCGL